MGSGKRTQSPSVQSLPELHGNGVYADNKNTVFGDKGSGEPEKKRRKAESPGRWCGPGLTPVSATAASLSSPLPR